MAKKFVGEDGKIDVAMLRRKTIYGRDLKEMRKAKDMTQTELSVLLGMGSRSYISILEKANADKPLSMAFKLSLAQAGILE